MKELKISIPFGIIIFLFTNSSLIAFLMLIICHGLLVAHIDGEKLINKKINI